MYKDKICLLLINSYMVNFDLSLEQSRVLSEEKFSLLESYIKEEKATLFGVVDSNELIGFIWLHKHTFFEEERLHVNQIVIDYQYRGKGIAKKLIKEAEDLALREGLSAIDLFVSENNVNALEMYKKLGFETERRYMKKKM